MLKLGEDVTYMSEQKIELSRRKFLTLSALAGTGVATGSLITNPLEAYAVTSAEKRAEAAAALEKLGALEEQLDEASANYGTALMAQEAAQAKMNEAQGRIDEANASIASLQEQLGTRARSMYRSGSISFIDMLLGAQSFQAFTTNWDVLNEMNENDSKMVEDTKALRSEVEQQKAVYTEQEAVAAEQAREAKAIEAEAQALVDEMENTYNSLSAEAEELFQQEEAARRAEEERLAQERARAAAAAANGGGGGNGGSGNSGGNASGPSAVNNNKPQTVPGDIVVARARENIGKWYGWGAVGPNTFDCSGLVGYCLKGTYARHWTTYQIYYWTQVTDPQPGDICIKWTHTGVYIGNGRMIHAPRSGYQICEAPVPGNMFFVRY